MRIGVCPGSFDPVTNGHVDIFERASKLVDKLIVLIAENPNKNYLFTLEERADLIRQSVAHIPNIEVDFGEGLLNDYVKSRDGHIIIRGLRALSDFEYEFQRALFSKFLDILIFGRCVLRIYVILFKRFIFKLNSIIYIHI